MSVTAKLVCGVVATKTTKNAKQLIAILFILKSPVGFDFDLEATSDEFEIGTPLRREVT